MECPDCGGDWPKDEYSCLNCGLTEGDLEYASWYDDGQPDEYTEWQDYMGGDDWDHGQYD